MMTWLTQRRTQNLIIMATEKLETVMLRQHSIHQACCPRFWRVCYCWRHTWMWNAPSISRFSCVLRWTNGRFYQGLKFESTVWTKGYHTPTQNWFFFIGLVQTWMFSEETMVSIKWTLCVTDSSRLIYGLFFMNLRFPTRTKTSKKYWGWNSADVSFPSRNSLQLDEST